MVKDIIYLAMHCPNERGRRERERERQRVNNLNMYLINRKKLWSKRG